MNKVAINFDVIRLQLRPELQARVTGTQIIDGNLKPHTLIIVDRFLGQSMIIKGMLLGKFDHDRFQRHTQAGQQLSGKAFLPLLSSYACAIPGIMATRTMDSAKQRLLTIMIAPWMSCTARLPVYALLIGMLLAGYGAMIQALVLAGLYLLGTCTALLAAWLFCQDQLRQGGAVDRTGRKERFLAGKVVIENPL